MAGRGGWFHTWRRNVRRRWKHRPGVVPWLLALPARFLLWLLRALPSGFSLWLVERVGRVMWWMPRRHRIGVANLAQALPERSAKERARIGRVSCGNFARNVAETLIFKGEVAPEQVLGHVRFATADDRTLLEDQRGRGAVFVLGHFGSMEGTMGLLGCLGLRPMTIVRLPTNYYVARALTAGREGWDVDLSPREGAMKRMTTRLKEGGSAILPMDVNARRGGIFVPWFGRLAATEPSAAWLALRTGRPVIVCWAIRAEERMTWIARARLVRAGSAPVRRPSEASLVEVTVRIHEVLEDAIRHDPEHYFWIHDRYRTRPPDETAGA